LGSSCESDTISCFGLTTLKNSPSIWKYKYTGFGLRSFLFLDFGFALGVFLNVKMNGPLPKLSKLAYPGLCACRRL
jgi:hypothetical protein